MKRFLLLCLFLPFWMSIQANTIIKADHEVRALSDKAIDAAFKQLLWSNPQTYIERFKTIAIMEMERTGVPASIKLAQGILESGSGTSMLSQRANNHFGIKCGSSWDGKTFYRKDDDFDAQGKLLESCFRVYRNPEESFIAHSEFLRDPRKEYRYGFLFRLDPTDYVAWAQGLRTSGYATNPSYDRLLVQIIERYNLQELDRIRPIDVIPGTSETQGEILAGIGYNNDVRVIIARDGETVQNIADRTGIRVDRLLRYNEMLDDPRTTLKENNMVYLQSKRNQYRGNEKYHYLKEGETMYSISQVYGVKLSKLYKRNRLEEGSQVAVGERIRLRGRIGRNDKPPRLVSDPLATITSAELLEMVEADEDFWSPSAPFGEDQFGEPAISGAQRPGIAPPPSTDRPTGTGGAPATPLPPAQNNPPPANNGSTGSSSGTGGAPATGTAPQTPTNPVTPPSASYHTVQSGDTLFSLSRRYGVTVERIRQLNGLTDNTIRIGQQLRVQ